MRVYDEMQAHKLGIRLTCTCTSNKESQGQKERNRSRKKKERKETEGSKQTEERNSVFIDLRWALPARP